MQKIYCNKETNMVEQILKVKTVNELPDDYFSNCYSVIDEKEEINGYNLRYNKKFKKFEIVEGIPLKDEVVVIKQPTHEDFKELQRENRKLKEENSNLAERIKAIEEVLNINEGR